MDTSTVTATTPRTTTQNKWERNSAHYAKTIEQAVRVMPALELPSSVSDELLRRLRYPDHVHQRELELTIKGERLTAFSSRVQHCNLLGDYKGGFRMFPSFNLWTSAFLALDMTLKAALFNLPLGGGKGGVTIDPDTLDDDELRLVVRSYVKAFVKWIGPGRDVLAPDLGTNPRVMQMFIEEYSKIVGKWTPGVVTGKPEELGGQPGRVDATGFGAAVLIALEAQRRGIPLGPGCHVAVHGFGNVGTYVASVLEQKYGCMVVAVCDRFAGTYNPNGLSMSKIRAGIKDHTFEDYRPAEYIHPDDIFELPGVQIIVPASAENVVGPEQARSMSEDVRLVGCAGNNVIHPAARSVLIERGIGWTPDYETNGGGLAVSYKEILRDLGLERLTKMQVLAWLEGLMVSTHGSVTTAMDRHKLGPEEAAMFVSLSHLAQPLLAV